MTTEPKELTPAEVAEELTKFCDLAQVASGRPVMVPIVDETFELLRRAAELLRGMGEPKAWLVVALLRAAIAEIKALAAENIKLNGEIHKLLERKE